MCNVVIQLILKLEFGAIYGHIQYNISSTFLVCECVTYYGVTVGLLFVHSFEMVNPVSQGNYH